jgi:hypothetical protein
MPLNGAQLSEMVNRARLKAPPVDPAPSLPSLGSASFTATHEACVPL